MNSKFSKSENNYQIQKTKKKRGQTSYTCKPNEISLMNKHKMKILSQVQKLRTFMNIRKSGGYMVKGMKRIIVLKEFSDS